jgi:hypothetical protein
MSPLTCTFYPTESEHPLLYTMHPPLPTQEYALIHLLMHTFIPMTKDAFSLAVEVNNKITHS